MLKRNSLFITLAGVFLFASCSKENTTRVEPSDVLVHVGDAVVTSKDLNVELQRFLGSDYKSANERVRKRVLDSLVQRQAMVVAAEKELSVKEKEKILNQVSRYHDNELIKLYISSHAHSQPITEKMVVDYYKANSLRFGEDSIKQYDMLIVPANVAKARVNDMQKFQVSSEWESLLSKMNAQGLNARIQSGKANDKMLHKKLNEAINGLQKGQTTDPIFIGKQAYMVRIDGEIKLPPKPLREVRSEIRKILAADVLKNNIKRASDLALEHIKIKYIKVTDKGL